MSLESTAPSGSGGDDGPSRTPSKEDLAREALLRKLLMAKFGTKVTGTTGTSTTIPSTTTTDTVPTVTTTTDTAPKVTTTTTDTGTKTGTKRKLTETTTPSAEKDKLDREARGKRFEVDLEAQRKEEAARDSTQEAYYTDFGKVCGTVTFDLGGSWEKHYNDDSPANSRFKDLVDRSGKGLEGYITHVVQAAARSDMTFSKADSSYPGDRSNFRIDLHAFESYRPLAKQ